MTGHQLRNLLSAAAEEAETCAAPVADPVAALARARLRREQRRGHLTALAFVVFVLGLQLWPAEALGANRSPGSAGAVTAAAAPAAPLGATESRRD